MSYLMSTERRAVILAAAVVVLERDGVDAITSRAVAAQASVSPGLVHHRFATTAELRAAAWNAYVQRERVAFDRVLQSDPRDAVELFFGNLTSGSNSAAVQVWSRAWMYAQRDSDFALPFAATFRTLHGALASALRDTADPEGAASRLLLLAFGLAGMLQIDPNAASSIPSTMRTAIRHELGSE